jgi:hypothetical protein
LRRRPGLRRSHWCRDAGRATWHTRESGPHDATGHSESLLLCTHTVEAVLDACTPVLSASKLLSQQQLLLKCELLLLKCELLLLKRELRQLLRSPATLRQARGDPLGGDGRSDARVVRLIRSRATLLLVLVHRKLALPRQIVLAYAVQQVVLLFELQRVLQVA